MPFSITHAAFEGIRVIRREPMAVVMWGVTYLVGLGLILLLAGTAIVGAVQGLSGNDPVAAMRAFGTIAMVYLIAIPLMIVVSSVIVAATCRAVLTPEQRGFFYMKLGAAEFRLMGAYLLTALIVLAVFIAFILVIGMVIGGSVMMGVAAGGAEGAPTAAVALIYPLYFAMIGFVVWLSARLSLVGPITVAEGRFALGASWRATKGRVWSLIDLGAATMVRCFVVYAVAVVLFMVLVAIVAGGSGGFDTLETATPAQVMAVMLPIIIVGAVLMAAYAAVQFTVISAPFVAFYRDVVAQEVAAPSPPRVGDVNP